jgi:hypothetical protein
MTGQVRRVVSLAAGAIAPAPRSASVANPSGRGLDRLDDALIAGAAAEHRGEEALSDPGLRRSGIGLEHREHEARAGCLAVHEHGARAADAVLAADIVPVDSRSSRRKSTRSFRVSQRPSRSWPRRSTKPWRVHTRIGTVCSPHPPKHWAISGGLRATIARVRNNGRFRNRGSARLPIDLSDALWQHRERHAYAR